MTTSPNMDKESVDIEIKTSAGVKSKIKNNNQAVQKLIRKLESFQSFKQMNRN